MLQAVEKFLLEYQHVSIRYNSISLYEFLIVYEIEFRYVPVHKYVIWCIMSMHVGQIFLVTFDVFLLVEKSRDQADRVLNTQVNRKL